MENHELCPSEGVDQFQNTDLPNTQVPKPRKSKAGLWLGLMCFLCAGVLCAVYFYFAPHAVSENFNTLKSQTEDAIRKAAYEKYYTTAEKKYHTSNRTLISLGDITEISELEVLEVQKTEYIIETPDDNDGKVACWNKYKGNGTFTVNLSAAEIIRDEEHQYVCIRVPAPKLMQSRFTLTGSPENLLYQDTDEIDITVGSYTLASWRNGDFASGTALQKKMDERAYTTIYSEMKADPQFLQSAKDSGTNMIKNLVKSWNPSVEGLTVDVEFLD